MALLTFAFLVLGMLRGAAFRAERREAQALVTCEAHVAAVVEITGMPHYREFSLAVEGRLVGLSQARRTVPTGTGTSSEYPGEGTATHPTGLKSPGETRRGGSNDLIHLRPRVYVTLFYRQPASRLPGATGGPACPGGPDSRDGGGLSVKPGDLLELWGELRNPEAARNPAEFDWGEYLCRRRIYLELRGELGDARVLSAYPASFLSWASWARWVLCSWVKTAVYANFPEESGRYLLAFMLGDQGELDPQETDMARYLGFIRFLSLTGFHVDVVMKFWYWVSRKLFRRPSLARLGAILTGALYLFIEGFGPSVARAFICNSLKLLAWELGKEYDHISAVSVSALTVATYVPDPLCDPGFLMSHGASLAAAFGPWLVPAVLVPLILTDFGELSLPGIILGSIYAWTGGLLLILVWFGAAVPIVSAVFGWIPHLVLTGFLFSAQTLCKVPWLRITTPAPNHLEMAGYYLGLAAFWYFRSHAEASSGPFLRPGVLSRTRASPVALVLLVISVSLLFAGSLTRVYVRGLEVVFLYAGQGDAALVRWGRRVMMVDTGTSESFRRHVLPYLRYMGVSRIDILVLSHLHDDHAGALESLLEWAAVEKIAVPRGRGNEVRMRLSAAGRIRTLPEVIEVSDGRTYEVDSLLIEVIHSGASTTAPGKLMEKALIVSQDGRENAESIAMFLKLRDFQGYVVEFWGDLPAAVTQKLLESEGKKSGGGTKDARSREIRIVKVPHHGAPDSLCPGFYERLRGGYAVISVGPNPHGHPSPEVIRTAVNAGVKVFRTDANGAVFVRLNGGKLRIDMYKE